MERPNVQGLRDLLGRTTTGRWRSADGWRPKVFLYAQPASKIANSNDVVMLGETYADGDGQGRANMKFLAAAHEELPAILDYVEDLEKRLNHAVAIARVLHMERERVRQSVVTGCPELARLTSGTSVSYAIDCLRLPSSHTEAGS